ncbi:acyl carrier protein [Chlorogloeopsis sp. ULAP01]|uniref:acyl carrier protein n=1 Tax=Chlorogloeopsis sp. ULAP01 TaxID=3056483 RepID=UPI0025AAF0D1|nr:acyl carrier protein [Chlorogloeopsis sp. ULAP01]MDM9383688.1 acyl carrier protein [Chlorogloeopsis sp. ULAP01]
MKNSTQQSQSAEAIQNWLVLQLAERLNIEPDELDIDLPFDNYDLNSNEALALLNKLEKWLGRSLSPTIVWNYPTIATLAERLAEETEVAAQKEE